MHEFLFNIALKPLYQLADIEASVAANMEESQEHAPPKPIKAWLTVLTGINAGCRYALDQPVTAIGLNLENHVVTPNDHAAQVSSRHAKITNEGHSFRIYDLNSAKGSFLNEHRIVDAILEPGDVIHLGQSGPSLLFETDLEDGTVARDQDLDAESLAPEKNRRQKKPITRRDEVALIQAVEKARQIRKSGGGDTVIIMREVLQDALRRGKRKHKVATILLLIALVSVSIFSAITIHRLGEKKNALDRSIHLIEARLKFAEDPSEISNLIDELEGFQRRARDIQTNLLYKIGYRNAEEDFILAEITQLMEDFGAPEYSIPPEFSERVQANILSLQNGNRLTMEKAFGSSREDLKTIRQRLKKKRLPPDLAYMVLVESAFDSYALSAAGAAGPWQFVASTARAYGLHVSQSSDERYDVNKSTDAAGRYIRHLILEFGSGDGVMLALAAYNLGPTRVKRAIRMVEDPIRQRDFWYLYRMRALPEETREYVPKVIAAIIIGRNPEKFGFIV